jgi:hypothetical protein
MAVVECTFTHRQYTEYRGRSTHSILKMGSKKNWEVKKKLGSKEKLGCR